MEPVTASAQLRAYRVSQGLSLLQFGRVLRRDPSMISKIETGARVPGKKLALRIEKVCGIDHVLWRKPADERHPETAVA